MKFKLSTRARHFRPLTRSAISNAPALLRACLSVSYGSVSPFKWQLVLITALIAVVTVVASHTFRSSTLRPDGANGESKPIKEVGEPSPSRESNAMAERTSTSALGSGGYSSMGYPTVDTDGFAGRGVTIAFQNTTGGHSTGDGLSIAFQNSTSGASNSVGQGVSVAFQLAPTPTPTPTPTTSADLALAMTASPNPVISGSDITYNITVTNNGPDAAQSVSVADSLPASTTFVSCNASGGGACGGSGNSRTVTFSSVAAGASETITLVASVKTSVANGTGISNTATVNSSTSDPNPTNDSTVTATTALAPQQTINLGVPGSANPSGTIAEPVNTATGNYIFQRTDLTIPGRGLPVIFTRTYNSLDSYSGELGAGWTHSYNILLTESPSGSVTIKQGDGRVELYEPTGGGNFTPRLAGVFNTLVKNPNGSFILTFKNQTQYHFSSTGRLASITDRNGNGLSLAYNGTGDLISITDTVGRIVSLARDASQRIALITDPIGRTVQYSYDASGNLTSVTNPNGGIMNFAYDAGHRVTEIHDESGTPLLANSYDGAGRVVDQTNGRNFTTTFAYGVPGTGDTTITDPKGNTTIHTHDSFFRLIQVTDANGKTVDLTYDSNNNRTGVTNQNRQTTSFNYDAKGNITGITDPLSNMVALTYGGKNDLITATNAKGNTTTFSYDIKGNLISILDTLGNTTTFAYDGAGQLTSKTDARGNATTFTYDASGNLIKITDALGKSSNLSYDNIARLISITDANGHTATANYDALSRLIKISDALGNQTQFVYDAVGNLLEITDAKGNATSYVYDGVNNLTSVTDAIGSVTRYAYDANNNRITFTNAKGNITSYSYDTLNRLVQITDPLTFVTSYSYDAVGNVLATTDASVRMNQFTYDSLNRLTAISYADGNSVSYSYDQNGNRIAMVDSHGTTAYQYDALDRVISVNNPSGKVVAYAYDAVGNRRSLTYPDGKTVSYTYDPAGRLSQVKDWLGRTTSYTYDPARNLTKILYSNAAAVAFSYDAANRLVQVRNSYRGSSDKPLNPVTSFTYVLDQVGNRIRVIDGSGKATSYRYDALSQLISVTKDTKVTKFAYDTVGNRTTLTAPGISVNYTYDAADRLLAAGSTTFTYDRNGNQISRTNSQGTLNYSYDGANRLIAALGAGVSSQFNYDGDGNRITQITASGTYNYTNDVGTPLPVVLQESGPDGDISYAYGLGLISESSSTFDHCYHYDGLGSVVGLTDSAGKLAGRYIYDVWGQTDLSIPNAVDTENKIRFTGEVLDPGTQLYYLRARYYDPSIGRFISRDPFAGFADFPQSLARYSYALNNGLRFIDPSGLLGLDSFFTTVHNFTHSRAGVITQGIIEVGGGIVLQVSGVAQLLATPVTGGTTAITGAATIAAGGVAIGVGAANIARGFENMEAFSLPQEFSKSFFGSEKPGQVFEFVNGARDLDPLPILDNLSTWWTEGLGDQVKRAGGLLRYLLFSPLPASGAQISQSAPK